MARQRRLFTRQEELKPLWESLVVNILSVQEMKLMPTFHDACKFATIVEMLADDDAHTTVTDHRILEQKEAILADIAQYQTKIKRELVRLYVSQPTIGGTANLDTTSIGETEDVDFSILDRATTLFKCDSSWQCTALLPYPTIFEHVHVKKFRDSSFTMLNHLKPEVMARPTAILLLKDLGLPEDTPAIAKFG